MCGFDSCYPCLMLLIFNQNRKRRNKIYRRRRGFLSKKTCLVVRRSKSFLRAKLRRFKIAFRHRLPKVKLKRRVIRQARRRFKIINTPKKRLYHFAQGARYLPKVPTSEVIFAQWISKTQSKTIFLIESHTLSIKYSLRILTINLFFVKLRLILLTRPPFYFGFILFNYTIYLNFIALFFTIQ